ncbi:hypothetical protein CsSME_00003888 [Camellia sinensis var. sinensis]
MHKAHASFKSPRLGYLQARAFHNIDDNNKLNWQAYHTSSINNDLVLAKSPNYQAQVDSVSKYLSSDNCCTFIDGVHIFEVMYKSKPVAVKVIQPDKTKFVREVAMLSRVKHDNIVKLTLFSHMLFIGAYVEPTMMIITELMRGGTLQKYLWSIRPNSPDLKLSISFALGISRAMEYLHANSIIHRDLKPSNLLLMEDKKKIKVADFGLAREETMGEMTAEVGTYRWMAPELFSVEPIKLGVKKHYNHKVDIYSFSMVLWELLTNSTPFKGRNNVMVAYASSMNGNWNVVLLDLKTTVL